jgi:hypothetical protein
MAVSDNVEKLQQRRTLGIPEVQLQSALEGICDDVAVDRVPLEELQHIEEMLTTASHVVRRALSSRQGTQLES